MFLTSVLRLAILGEPLLKPPQSSPFKLFVYETSSNLTFDIYLAFLVLFLCIGVFMIFYKRWGNGGGAMLYIIGFLLIFCSYSLQRVTEINKLLRKVVGTSESTEKRWFWERWFFPWNRGTSNSLRERGSAAFLSRHNFTGLLTGSTPLPDLKVSHLSPAKITKETLDPKKTSLMDLESEDSKDMERSKDNVKISIKTDKNGNIIPVKPRKNEMVYKGLITRIKENPLIETKKVRVVFRNNRDSDMRETRSITDKIPKESGSRNASLASSGVDKAEKREALLSNLLKLFEFKLTTDESLEKHVLYLKNTQRQVKAMMDEFVDVFKCFMKEAEKIQDEMLAFNASTRYLDMVLDELKTEIRKYFGNLPDLRIHREISAYISTLVKNYRTSDGGEDITAGDIDPIAKYEGYIIAFLVAQVLCCLLLFVAVLVRLDTVVTVLKPIVSIFLIITILFNVIFLLTGQMLDRNCKAGVVKGCSFTQTLAGGMSSGSRRSEVISRTNDLRNQLEAIIEETDRTTRALRSYIGNIVDEKVNIKVSIFSNLFSKILFVYEDFSHLTGDKVDKDKFYDRIRVMNRTLENITTLLNLSGYKDLIDIHADEAAFSFWLKADKDVIIKSIRDITEAGPSDKLRMPTKWCVNALQAVCNAKDETDDLFTLIFFGGPIFVFLLYL